MASSPESSLFAHVEAYLRDHDLLDAGQRVVVGISGGVDSMVLAAVLQRLGYRVQAAHINYGLRGTESDADEDVVRAWCGAQQPPIPVRVARCDPDAKAADERLSLQEAARQQRYAFMAQCAAEQDTDRVAVGHHRGDQAETLLLNLFRGSGVEGLAGMAPRRPLQDDPPIDLVRPLLTASRSAIEAYAQAQGLPWRTDASNRAIKYDRNTIRHRILPVIEAHFEGARARIAQTADLVRAYRTETVEPALETYFNRCATATDAGGVLDTAALRALPAVWRRRVLLEALTRWMAGAPYQGAFAEEIEALLTAQVGRRVEVSSGTIWRERGALRFVNHAVPALAQPRSVPFGEEVVLPHGTLQVERVEEPPEPLGAEAPDTVYADAHAVQGPLAVRTWQNGDRFQPLGMTHTKKISDFLTDEQVPPHRRQGVLVLRDRERIVWVVGHRLAHPVRIRPDTTAVLRMHFEPAAGTG
jgi:tRNA(Ile)-lysidine synthase